MEGKHIMFNTLLKLHPNKNSTMFSEENEDVLGQFSDGEEDEDLFVHDDAEENDDENGPENDLNAVRGNVSEWWPV